MEEDWREKKRAKPGHPVFRKRWVGDRGKDRWLNALFSHSVQNEEKKNEFEKIG